MQRKNKIILLGGIGVILIVSLIVLFRVSTVKQKSEVKVITVKSNEYGFLISMNASAGGIPVLVEFDKEKVDNVTISADKGEFMTYLCTSKLPRTITQQTPEVIYWRNVEGMNMEKENQKVDTITIKAYKGKNVVEQRTIPIMYVGDETFKALECDIYDLDNYGKPLEE